jgi:ABC-type Zn uptake system ZnuABC Zn-binding protein ZnuA
MKIHIALILTLSLVLMGCSNQVQPEKVSTIEKKTVIVTSFFPITHLVAKIVGNQAEIIQILPE